MTGHEVAHEAETGCAFAFRIRPKTEIDGPPRVFILYRFEHAHEFVKVDHSSPERRMRARKLVVNGVIRVDQMNESDPAPKPLGHLDLTPRQRLDRRLLSRPDGGAHVGMATVVERSE